MKGRPVRCRLRWHDLGGVLNGYGDRACRRLTCDYIERGWRALPGWLS